MNCTLVTTWFFLCHCIYSCGLIRQVLEHPQVMSWLLCTSHPRKLKKKIINCVFKRFGSGGMSVTNLSLGLRKRLWLAWHFDQCRIDKKCDDSYRSHYLFANFSPSYVAALRILKPTTSVNQLRVLTSLHAHNACNNTLLATISSYYKLLLEGTDRTANIHAGITASNHFLTQQA